MDPRSIEKYIFTKVNNMKYITFWQNLMKKSQIMA